MDLVVALKALIMGVVEGLTEFLPVSSTGHLIVAGSLLNWNDEKGKLFEIVIQFAAILAVCWLYRQRLWKVVSTLPRERQSQRFTLNLVLAFLPAAVLGVIFIGTIKKYLFAPVPVAMAFIIGGVLILWIESRKRIPRITEVDGMAPPDAIWIGFAQALSMIPGTSRSGATIMGGLLRGLSRPAATEFSFFLAIPTIFGATVLELFKARHTIQLDDLAIIGVGSLASFISASFAVRALIRYVSGHNFKVFAWYRIAFGLVILATWHFGWVKW
jgi:undecaprenyl-diphosphatase